MSKARKSLLIVIAGALAVAGISAYLYPPPTNAQKRSGASATPAGRPEALDNYDIRTDKTAGDKIASLRGRAGRQQQFVDAVRSRQEVGVETIQQRIPGLKIDRSETTGLPEVIGTDVTQGRAFLSGPSSTKRPERLKLFLADNSDLIGLSDTEVVSLRAVADYTNPDGALSFVELQQEIDGIPVFQGEVKAGFTKAGEIIRIVSNLAAGVTGGPVSSEFGDPIVAATAAAGHVNVDARTLGLSLNASASTPEKQVLGPSDASTTAEKTYFPTEPGVVVPAWRVMIWSEHRAYYVVVDASTGSLLWRKCLTDDQTQSASYMVYVNSTNMTAASNSLINAPDSPYPLTPGPLDPALGTQGSAVARSIVTLVGNEAPYTFNQLGWITDGNNTTDGNNVQAGLDRKLPNDQLATDIDPDGLASGVGRVFNFPVNPADPGSGAGGSPTSVFNFGPGAVDIVNDRISQTAHGLTNNMRVVFATTGTLPSPLVQNTSYFVVNAVADTFSLASTSGGAAIDLTDGGSGTHTLSLPSTPCIAAASTVAMNDYQRASVTQLFYLVNRFHDVMYQFGFNEAAHNFQNVNFTGQGSGGDRVSAQAQDCSSTNNADFTTPADGSRGYMQMYLWPGSGNRMILDGSLDADVVLHEHTHGLSNRLHGNALGLSTNMAKGMGEGWSDFYAKALLAEPTDPVQGVYTIGGYVTSNAFAPAGGSNYYYGIRRYPLDVISHTGGANNKPHNAFTFSYLNNDCNSRMTTSNFAFARNPVFVPTVTACDQVHRIGEIWSSMLWEARGRFIARLGAVAGNRRILQLVTDGMKLAPIGPTFITERDAIIAAAYAGGDPNDVKDLWDGFAARGLGASATIQAIGSGSNNTVVTDAFDAPNLTQSQNITVSDLPGDGDGYAEPGENININVPITNATGATVNSISVNIAGGGTNNYGSLNGAQTATQPIAFTVPAGTACGTYLPITINVSSSLGQVSFARQIFVGKPATTSPTQNFDGVAAPSLPSGWTATAVQGGINFVNSTTTPDSAPNAVFAQEPTTVGGGTDLTSPPVLVTSGAATMSFRHSYNTENGWDGGVLEISIGGNPFQDILTAGGSFSQNGYPKTVGGGTNNPIAGRLAWTGNSGGYVTTTVQLPSAAVGRLVQLRWRFGSDDNTAVSGWLIDTISLTGAAFVTSYSCQVTPPTSAPLSVGGRVVNFAGAGLRAARVTMVDGNGQTRVAITNAFGYYSFSNVTAGQSVTLTAASRGLQFPAQTVSVSDTLSQVNFAPIN